MGEQEYANEESCDVPSWQEREEKRMTPNYQGGDPSGAPDPSPPVYRNVGTVEINELSTVGEVFAANKWDIPEGISPDSPYWNLVIPSLDARWSDGGQVFLFRGTKLFDKNGEQLDNTQRPAMINAAFAGLGIRGYPAGDAYDPDAVVGHTFRFLMQKRSDDDPGRPVPLAEADLGTGFIFTGKVRTIGSAQAGGEGATATTAAPVIVDLSTDKAAQAKLREALTDTDLSDEDAVTKALQAASLMNATIDGQGLVGHIVNGTLEEALAPILAAAE